MKASGRDRWICNDRDEQVQEKIGVNVRFFIGLGQRTRADFFIANNS